MHIAEGMLPMSHALAWWGLSGAAAVASYQSLRSRVNLQDEKSRLRLAGAGAFAFLLSALKLPSFTGSCSHPTGLGPATVLYGPASAVLISFWVLLLQALLLAHGGLTTLGANLFAMGIAGPAVLALLLRLAGRMKWPRGLSIVAASTLGDLVTYVVTSLQLGLAFPDPVAGFWFSAQKFLLLFALTQLPLACLDGYLTWLVVQRLEEGQDA